MIRRILAIILILCASAAFGLEVEEGRMRLVIHEETGRFSLYYLQDTRTDRYIPLILAQDPRTSVLSLYDEGRVYRLGESPIYSVEASALAGGAAAELRFQTATVSVIQRFSFVHSEQAEQSNAVRLDLILQNTSDQPRELGLRLLLDTYLGESSNIHFSTRGTQRITRETELGPQAAVDYWTSPAQSTDSIGLRYFIDGPQISSPNRVVFANWKRLNEAAWEYEVNSSRNFNLLPYSINDSAAAVYYGPTVLPRRSEEVYTTVLANSSAQNVVLGEESVDVAEPSTPGTELNENQVGRRRRLREINTFIDEINTRLTADEPVGTDQVVALRRGLEESRASSVDSSEE